MFRKLTTRQLTVDVTIAALCWFIRVPFIAASGYTVHGFLVLLMVTGMAAALAVRRLSPGLALGIAWFAVFIQLSTGQSPDIANIAIPPVLYVTARYGTPAVRWAGLASAFVGAFVATVYSLAVSLGIGFGYSSVTAFVSELPRTITVFIIGFVLASALFAISWTLGLLARSRRTTIDVRLAKEAAEAEQHTAEREVVVEQERTRIARDMHDVVAHSLAVVIAQADGARYAMKNDPATADEALSIISGTAREALADVRVLLGQLRHDEGTGPQPVLADLDRLFEQMRAAGLTIRREDAGESRPLATAQQLAVYRIVQESLTNALRHGDPAAEVSVSLAWAEQVLTVEVSNGLADAPAIQDARPGHGLAGMRERAFLVGGSLRAGEHDGRWVVSAALPAGLITQPVPVVA